jgi:hypothetical protein
VLTDNGIQFADLSKNRDGPTARWRGHPFDRAGWGMVSNIASPNPTSGRMNRTLKEATARRYRYETHRQLENHLAASLRDTTLQGDSRPFTASHPMKLSVWRG